MSDRNEPPELDAVDDDPVGDLRGVVIDESSSVTTVPEPPSGPAQPPTQKPPAGAP